MMAELFNAYQRTWRVLVVAPVFLVLPTTVEGAQHAVEWSVGMFSDEGGFLAAGDSTVRGLIGMLKVGAILLTALLVGRFWQLDASLAQALHPSRRSLGALALGGLTVALMTGGVLLAGPWLAGLAEELAGPGLRIVGRFSPVLVFAVTLVPFEWVATYALGTALDDADLRRERIHRAPPWIPVLLVLGLAPPFLLDYGLSRPQ